MPAQSKFGESCTAFLTQRVPEKLMYEFDLLARATHTRRSEVIARALTESVKRQAAQLQQLPAGVTLSDLWDESPAARFVKLVTLAPSLMSLDDKVFLSRLTCEDRYWNSPAPADSAVWPPNRQAADLKVAALTEDWPGLQAPSL